MFGRAVPPAQEQADSSCQPFAQDADSCGLLRRRQVSGDRRVRPPAVRAHLGSQRTRSNRRIRRP